MTDLRVFPAAGPLSGTLRLPGDKSVSHRAVLLAGRAAGESRIHGFLESADTRATLAAVVALGAQAGTVDGELRIRGAAWRAPEGGALDLGNSGTGMRLLAGCLASGETGAPVTLTGDASLSRRPMDRIIEPLTRMGASLDSTDGHAPLVIRPGKLTGIDYTLPMASAQVKSALLLAGLRASGITRVTEPEVTRDHTERLLPAFGIEIGREGGTVAVSGGQSLTAADLVIPGDLSAAAFWLVAGSLVSGSRVSLEGVGVNPTRDGILRILELMGADFGVERLPEEAAEPRATITVASSCLASAEIPAAWVPLAIDEFPVIMVAAARARGRTHLTGAAELRVKESDRLALMCRNLAVLGVRVRELDDGFEIEGGPVAGGRVDAGGDHRIAMALAVLALVADGPVTIENAEWIETSYPGFTHDLRILGGHSEWLEAG